ncbi:MAG: AbrB/MazE/SpoVT family DNA-binding domain-containing protein [Defluviitaleaceae bacterium]|nr:AbrB/MazE/SpoVT family DNA-binding domain-containing protein [Defluviitaleaceae bacterium]
MTATIKRVDDNYIVNMPASFFKNINFKENEHVQIIEEYGKIIIQKSENITLLTDTPRKNIAELFEGYEDEYESVLIDWGAPVGKEIW